MSTKEGADQDRETRQFVERTLLSLANDLVMLSEAHEAVATKIRAIALAHRIDIPQLAAA